jgi:hypothetical protein
MKERRPAMVPDDEKFQYAKPRKPHKLNPELERELEALGFRPFTDEW